MASQGPNSPSSASNVANTAFAWSNVTNVFSSDNSYATNTCSGNTDYILATGFGFSIPSGATIDGIVVEVEDKCNIAGVSLLRVILYWGGTDRGLGKSSASDMGTSDAYESMGSSVDTWNAFPAGTNINLSDFGVKIWVTVGGKSAATVSVDHVRITAYYTGGGGGGGSAVKQRASFSCLGTRVGVRQVMG